MEQVLEALIAKTIKPVLTINCHITFLLLSSWGPENTYLGLFQEHKEWHSLCKMEIENGQKHGPCL